MRIRSVPILAVVLAACAALAATPPPDLNYQGVLRDASNRPLDGTYDMVFAFYDASTGGSQILVDQHASSTSNAVTVSNGLFDVDLGGGTVSDGTGPGIYTSLDQVFRDYGGIWLEIQVVGETLSPRVRVLSSGFSLNAANLGGKAPSSYLDTSARSQSKSGSLSAVTTDVASTGVTGGGTGAGGYFFDTDSSGYALVGNGDFGILGYGSSAGAYFTNTDNTCYAYLGQDQDGIRAFGNNAGGYFKDLDGSGYAYVGGSDVGISAYGNAGGGYFSDLDDGSYAWAAYGPYGIKGVGNTAGGYFVSPTATSYSYVGAVNDGIRAYGTHTGGEFECIGASGSAWLADGDYGIDASGNAAGGTFSDSDSSGYAMVAAGDVGVQGYGDNAGGYFSDFDSTGYAYVGYDSRGIWGIGSFAGGTFSSPDLISFWADVATPVYKIHGTGAVSFVQNHPYDKNEEIVYAAPEGDEAAVYTRGSARLVDGEARVPLGDTFRLVANPDIGLTAHLTPRGDPIPLAVESVTPTELVVRGPAGSNDAFDYFVYGLRIGFEELAIVQPKERPAFLPDPAAIQAPYADHPELRSSNALSRFTAMRQAMGVAGPPDLAGAHALASAIDENRSEIVAAASAAAAKERPATPRTSGPSPRASGKAEPTVVASTHSSPIPSAAPAPAPAPPLPAGAAPVPVAEEVRSGDVLAIDPAGGPALRRAASTSDPGVVGIVAGEPDRAWTTTAPLAFAGTVVLAHADASYGAILPGDLLAASPTPGYAMRAGTAPVQGTVVAKALEPLTSGTGTIRVLAMSH